MEPFTLPSIPLGAQSWYPFVHVEASGGWFSVPTYISGTSDWIPVYLLPNGGGHLMATCEVKAVGTVGECMCEIVHEGGSFICGGGRATILLGNELQACKISITPDLVQSVQSIKASGGVLSKRTISRFCHTELNSGANLVIPVGTVKMKPYQKAPGYHYTPTWMVDAPEWAFPTVSVGPNLRAVCKGHLKDSQLSCECSILGKDGKPIMVCPSRNSVPLAGPLNSHETQHCELYLLDNENEILSFKTKEERLNKAVASKDMDWPCRSTKLVAPTPAIALTSTSSKELDIARILLEFADEGRSLSSDDVLKETPNVVSEKHSSKVDSDIPTESAAARSDMPLLTPRMQENDEAWEAELNAKANKITDLVDRENFIKTETLRRRISIRNRKYSQKKKQAKAVASGDVPGNSLLDSLVKALSKGSDRK